MQHAPPSQSTIPDSGLREGLIAILPVLLAAAPFGLLIGTLAVQKGLSPLEVTLMSAFVFAGAAQFIAVDLWTLPTPVLLLAVTTLIVNLRHVLMSAAIAPQLPERPRLLVYGGLFFLVDESWAIAMKRSFDGRLTWRYYFALAIPLYVVWVGSSLLGALFGAAIEDPAAYGLDFAFTAIFICLVAGLWRGRGSLLPWIAGAAVALLAERFLPGVWYILLGGIAGTAVGALRREPGR